MGCESFIYKRLVIYYYVLNLGYDNEGTVESIFEITMSITITIRLVGLQNIKLQSATMAVLYFVWHVLLLMQKNLWVLNQKLAPL